MIPIRDILTQRACKRDKEPHIFEFAASRTVKAMFARLIVLSREFDPVINKTFSFILAMDWRGVALAFLVVSKDKRKLLLICIPNFYIEETRWEYYNPVDSILLFSSFISSEMKE